MGSVEGLDFLFENGKKLEQTDEKGRTPLSIACEYCQIQSVKWLLTKGANPNTIDIENRSPLINNARSLFPSHDIAQLLIHYKGINNINKLMLQTLKQINFTLLMLYVM